MKSFILAVMSCVGFLAVGETIEPGTNASETRLAIQSAIDATAGGTVTLASGLFELDAQLMLTNGVVLAGQGSDLTVLKFAGTKNTSSSRVATVNGGSTLTRVAVTGSSVVAQNGAGAVSVSDGTVSYCCITNNTNTQGTGGGITVNGSGVVTIDHTVVVNNSAATFFDGVGGGIGIRGDNGLRVTIDGCEVRGNRTGGSKDRHGAGIGIASRGEVTTLIRNTTVEGNSLTGEASLGGGLYIAQADTTLEGCRIYGNTAETTVAYFGDADLAFATFAVESAVAANSSGNVFSDAAESVPPALGTLQVTPSVGSVSIAGIIRATGSDADACDVYLSLDGAAAMKIAAGATVTFDYDAVGLAADTTYTYTLAVSNNAASAAGVVKSGSFTTRKVSDPVLLADYLSYRKLSGTPQSVLLTYYDGPDTRGFSWQTAASVTTGKVWLRKGDYASADDIRGKSDTIEIDATSVVHTANNCTTHRAASESLSEGLWSYCLGSDGKTACGQFTIGAADTSFVAVNVNDIQTKIASRLSSWGNVIDATCATLPSGFDFILSGGDFIDGSSDVGADDYVQWGVVADTARGKFGDAPWILACGNHESEAYDRGYDIFRELACEKFDYTSAPKHDGCHAFMQGGACILSLPYYDNGSVVPKAVENWIVAKLAAASEANWRIVVLHAGPYTTGDHGAGAAFLQQLTPIFAAGKVDLVLQAHDHTYSRTLPYRWSGVGHTKIPLDAEVVNLDPVTTNVQEFAGVPFYHNPEGTFYVSAGCAGHRVGELTNYASGKDVFSFSNRTYKTEIDSVKISSKYAAAGSLGSKDVGMPMFAVLKVNGGLLTYDWYVAEKDGSATLFDTLRICKEVQGALPPEPDPGTGTEPDPGPGTEPDPGTDPDDPGETVTSGCKVTFTVRYEGSASLSGIPVLVRLSAGNPVGFSYSDCAADGSDIRFVDADGRAIPFEIDTWNPNGESLVWVRAPSVTKGSTFTMVYGTDPSAVNVPTDVWSAYTGVWHFESLDTAAADEYSSGTYANATATENIDGHLSANSFAGEAGRFGNCFRVNDSTGMKSGSFNQGGVWVNDPGADSALDGGENFTISGWFKHKDFNYYYDAFFYKRAASGYGDANASAFSIESNRNNGPEAYPIVRGKGATGTQVGLADNLRGAWGYLTFVFKGNTCAIYENGVLQAEKAITPCVDNDDPLVFGNKKSLLTGGGDAAWNGWIDEVRYAQGAKSADWIAAEYAAMAGEGFLTAGEVERVGSLPTYLAGKSQDVVGRYVAWAAKNGADTESLHEESFLLDCGMDVAALTEAKAAFVITRITYDEAAEAWICEVADGVGEGGAYGNGYVHFISVRDSFPGAAGNSDFLRAVLLYAPVNGD